MVNVDEAVHVLGIASEDVDRARDLGPDPEPSNTN